MDKERFPRAVTDLTARACSGCGKWPCVCRRDKPIEFSLRTVTCACGGRFTSGGTSDNVGRAILAHATTARHQAWRAKNGIA
jgi:hypothetical protein